MPFSKNNLDALPDSTKNLTKKQKEKFVDVFNALAEEGMEESQAIPLAITRAKSRKKVDKSKFQVFKSTDDELMEAVEVVYVPNTLDVHNQWMSPKTVRKACESFNKSLEDGVVKPNLFHAMETEAFSIMKSWINECECYIGDQFVPEGTWIAKLKYHDQELWELKKAGDLQGVSISAKGLINPPKSTEVTDEL